MQPRVRGWDAPDARAPGRRRSSGDAGGSVGAGLAALAAKKGSHVRRGSRGVGSACELYVPELPGLAHARLGSREGLSGKVGDVLRVSKSTQRFVADARLRVRKSKVVGGFEVRLCRLLALLFMLLFVALFVLLRCVFGVRDAPTHPGNWDRLTRGESPLEYWPGDVVGQSVRFGVPMGAVNPDKVKALRGGGRRVSLVAACRDRTGFLQTVLPGWLAAMAPDDEIVLVDWGTATPDHVPVQLVVEALKPKDPRVTVVSVPGAETWVLSRAYNLGLSLARGEWILKVDCDTAIGPHFLDKIILPPSVKAAAAKRAAVESEDASAESDDRFFYRFSWEHARSENEQHLNGVVLARAEDLRRVYGYDERIGTYGWDDSDLYERLEKEGASLGHGLAARQMPSDSLAHVKHPDELRGANQRLVQGPTLETQVNQLALGILPAWRVEATQSTSRYALELLSKDARYVQARVVNSPPPVLNRLSTVQRAKVISEAKDRLLHDVYGFPWGVLSEINRSRGELVRSLNVLGRSTHWLDANGLIFAEIGGSAAQRLLGMASAVALAAQFERPLFVAWSSGSREEPTPRVSDFFDVDRSGVMDDVAKFLPQYSSRSAGSASPRPRSIHIFQIGRWRCRSSVAVCTKKDPAFHMMTEFRTGGHHDERAATQAVLDTLNGKSPGKKNVLLRLEGSIPGQRLSPLAARALSSLVPSPGLAEHIRLLGDVSGHLGVYLGPSIRPRSVEAIAGRLEPHIKDSTGFFVSGMERESIHLARKIFAEAGAAIANATVDEDGSGATEEIRHMIRDIAELYALGNCKEMIRDGRPPPDAIEAVALVRQGRALR